MSIRKLIQNNPILRYRYILEMWKLAKVQRWAAGHPFFSRWAKLDLDVSPEESDAVIIPIQETIHGTENTVLPYQILNPIIQKADGHMLLNRCPCRNGEGCSTYPHDFGCLFLGEAVRGVSNKIGTQTSRTGAMKHIEQALDLGLVPMIVHASFDAALISVPYHKMLAVCFCCDCCCTVRHHMRQGPSSFDDTIQRLPGLSVTINKNCTACGDCHDKCPVHAIDFVDHISVIDQDLCKGCGVCAAICPEGAAQLNIDDSEDTVEALLNRIRSRTNIGV
jgi:UDP-glucose 4-epimerase